MKKKYTENVYYKQNKCTQINLLTFFWTDSTIHII